MKESEWAESYDGDCCWGNYDDAHSHGITIGKHRAAKEIRALKIQIMDLLQNYEKQIRALLNEGANERENK